MSRPNVEEIARGTETAKGSKAALDRDVKPRPRAIVECGKLYPAAEIQAALGASDTTFADWKRNGLETVSFPAGDMITGDAVIEFARTKRLKIRQPRGSKLVPS